uniref:Uncharacterized protein n=1 Tax=Anguilla anguilla TaxID=7936 RepID=A0A0E9UAX2_ANGAN
MQYGLALLLILLRLPHMFLQSFIVPF